MLVIMVLLDGDATITCTDARRSDGDLKYYQKQKKKT